MTLPTSSGSWLWLCCMLAVRGETLLEKVTVLLRGVFTSEYTEYTKKGVSS